MAKTREQEIIILIDHELVDIKSSLDYGKQDWKSKAGLVIRSAEVIKGYMDELNALLLK